MLPQTQSGLSIVGWYSYLHEGDLAKSLLDSEGIRAWLLDENQIRHRWHLGMALGGIKLAVAPAFAERARELLSQDCSANLSEIPEQQLPPHEDEICPQCAANAKEQWSRQQWSGPIQWIVAFAFLLLGLVAARRRFVVTRRCGSCGHQWSLTEHR